MNVEEEGNGELAAHGIVAKLSWAFCSTAGPTRATNEDFADAYVPTIPDDAWDRGPLFVVADGMGGHAAGEVASRVGAQAAISSWQDGAAAPPQQALRSAVRAANVAVYDAALEPGHHGMGTTITALTLAERSVLVGNVGDSRAYLVRGDECLQLTSDHSRVGEMLRMKMITPEQAATHPARSQLTRVVGADPTVQVDVVRRDMGRGDGFVLCSDGLWDLVSRVELTETVGELRAGTISTPADAARALVDRAVARGAADNVTAVVVLVTSDLPIPAGGRRSLFRRRRG